MDTLTSFLLNEDSALPFDSFNENVLQNLPHQAGQWDILDPLVPFADSTKYAAGSPCQEGCAAPAQDEENRDECDCNGGSPVPLLDPAWPQTLPGLWMRESWCQGKLTALTCMMKCPAITCRDEGSSRHARTGPARLGNAAAAAGASVYAPHGCAP